MAKTNNIEAAKAVDYAENMFEEGHNRKQKVQTATGYDKAAHTPGKSEDFENPLVATHIAVAESQAGTESSGEYDETGGPLGGTEQELDDMEATARPVDRTKQMNE